VGHQWTNGAAKKGRNSFSRLGTSSKGIAATSKTCGQIAIFFRKRAGPAATILPEKTVSIANLSGPQDAANYLKLTALG